MSLQGTNPSRFAGFSVTPLDYRCTAFRSSGQVTKSRLSFRYSTVLGRQLADSIRPVKEPGLTFQYSGGGYVVVQVLNDRCFASNIQVACRRTRVAACKMVSSTSSSHCHGSCGHAPLSVTFPMEPLSVGRGTRSLSKPQEVFGPHQET